jgi:lysozyme family protein
MRLVPILIYLGLVICGVALAVTGSTSTVKTSGTILVVVAIAGVGYNFMTRSNRHR